MTEKNETYYPKSIREEELKNKVAKEWFGAFDCTRIIGNVDFCVSAASEGLDLGYEGESLLWAEAKAGAKRDIVASFVQLILTIGGKRVADKRLPPRFLGAFDAEKIAFLPYEAVLEVFGKNDFDWTVAPSDHETREFKELYALVEGTIRKRQLLFRYAGDGAELRKFIASNFKARRSEISKILITKNNFTHIYRQWREKVMPFVNAPWDVLKTKYSIYDRDFYLAEMNIDDNDTVDVSDDRIANDFYITFDAKSTTPYSIKRKNEDELFTSIAFGFKPGGLEAYSSFWRLYKRPPRKEYWDYIVDRLDLLVPQDVRERKGSFFTPKIWVEKSQQYLADALGENWQDEYVVWDCCAGTGNLLTGLTNKYNVWASTLDQADVDVMHDRIRNGANLLDAHVFQFDFLNDSFDKLPQGLKEIIDDPERRKKLVIYINPPYAEVSSKVAIGNSPKGKRGVNISATHAKYFEQLGTAGRELFAQFLIRISKEISGSIVGQFSKLKHLTGAAFAQFRRNYQGTIVKGFAVPADTFDNVKGKFPIGFFVWQLGKGAFLETIVDVYDRDGAFIGTKTIGTHTKNEYINAWISQYKRQETDAIGYMDGINGNDFQHNNIVYIIRSKELLPNPRGVWIACDNLFETSVYLAIRHCIEANWLNDRDQFLFPNDGWKSDIVFQLDCLVSVLFHKQNHIKSADGVNHWIPFTETEVGAKDCFASHFMSDFLAGKAQAEGAAQQEELALQEKTAIKPFVPLKSLSAEAKTVLDAGRELWRYYHAQPDANPNASYYDIRMYFQGTSVDAKGKVKMSSDSSDATYTELLATLRTAMKALAKRIEPKVYEYGFLRK